MAYKQTIAVKKKDIVTPSQCGSHASMMSTNDAHADFNSNCSGVCILEDARGFYVTVRDRLDNKFADSNRNVSVAERVQALDTVLAI